MVIEDMELGELDLDGIEKACDNPTIRYIPFEKITLLKEVILKTIGVRGLGVVSEPMKGGKEKDEDEDPTRRGFKKWGESWWHQGNTQRSRRHLNCYTR